jgi:hypothetical protein
MRSSITFGTHGAARFRRLRLTPFLLSAILATAVLVAVGYWVDGVVRERIATHLRQQLETVRNASRAALSLWIRDQLAVVQALASAPEVVDGLRRLAREPLPTVRLDLTERAERRIQGQGFAGYALVATDGRAGHHGRTRWSLAATCVMASAFHHSSWCSAAQPAAPAARSWSLEEGLQRPDCSSLHRRATPPAVRSSRARIVGGRGAAEQPPAIVGVVLDRLGHYDDAVTALRKAIEFAPRVISYHQTLSFTPARPGALRSRGARRAGRPAQAPSVRSPSRSRPTSGRVYRTVAAGRYQPRRRNNTRISDAVTARRWHGSCECAGG